MNDDICPKSNCDICKKPEKIKKAASEYLLKSSNYKNTSENVESVSLLGGNYNTSDGPKRLMDGSLASFAPLKRTFDEYSSVAEYPGFQPAKELYRNSSDFGGFKTAKQIHQDTNPFFGKKSKDSSEDESVSKYPLLHYDRHIKGSTREKRDKSITKLIKALAEKYDTLNQE
ncbi:hypothetical protein HDV01_007732 [Terramyces sp. JEL0728]|nr:hypothetical protein HDV01_007732 [Terramyces sp. JEL0728]